MRRFLGIMLCFLALPVMGSHIVGGEFEIRHINGNTYRINLILYFDKLNGNPGAKDLSIEAAIFRKSDNVRMQSVFFGTPTESNVEYTQPDCSHGEVQTLKLVYSTTQTLSDSRFDDPEGYYIAWERCCRNYTITNIYSNDPASGGIAAGQTFYLEFPPVVKDGEPFINSTPRLFPPLNDYACPRKPYYVDFAGVDDDGDSLVYSIVTPLSTHTVDALPPLRPRPYPEVDWRPPFNLTNIIAGAPDLKISTDGFLTATPSQQGLYVFAVKCEEYRDGEKIGEVRRDFQMLVVDVCPRAEPPNIVGKKLTDAGFSYDENMSITFSNTVDDVNRCIEVQVSDPDASNQDDNFTENIHIRAIPLNFKKDISGILPTITSATLINGSTMNFQICFDKCPYFEGGPFQVGIVAYDDACSLPLSDTLKITVNIQPPANNNVRFTTPNITQTLNEGSSATWPIRGVDDDGDQIVVAVFTNGFNPADVGMTLTQTKNENGEYLAQLVWDTRCDVYDFTHKTDFEIKILIEDVDYCKFSHPDTMVFKLKVKLPGNLDPIIDSDLTSDANERTVKDITRKINERLSFNVFGADGDGDFLILGAKGIGFNISDYNISFPGAQGNANVTSPFLWNISCDKVDLKVKDKFQFQFIVVDNANKCRFYKADTLDVFVQLKPPDNSRPDLRITSTSPTVPLVADSVSIVLGEQISLSLIGVDLDINPNKDLLHVELIEATGNVPPTGYIFAPAEGSGTATTTFVWKPDCSVFENGVYKNNYDFTFRVYDDKCFNPKGDTVKIAITVRDVENNADDFLPPNFITPNGDNKNDYFAMVKEDPITKELVSILPKDNCLGHFVGMRIYDRWGKEVYSTENRDFKWYPERESGGVYYYFLLYSDKEYKGSITVRE